MERDSSHLGAIPETLQAMAAPVAGKGRASPALVREVIVRLCAGHYLTADELGKLLDRNPDGLRNRYLSPMVTEGLLKLRYPDAANRPDQAYTTVDKNP